MDRDELQLIAQAGANSPRKHAIANGQGFVNGENIELDSDYGLNDDVIF